MAKEKRSGRKADAPPTGHSDRRLAPAPGQHDSHIRDWAFLKRLERLGQEEFGKPDVLERFSKVGWPQWLLLHTFRNYTQPDRTAEQYAEIRRLLPEIRAARETLMSIHALMFRSEEPRDPFELPPQSLLSAAADLLSEVEGLAPARPKHAPAKERERMLRLVFAKTCRGTTVSPQDKLGWIFFRAVFDVDEPRNPADYIRRRQEDEACKLRNVRRSPAARMWRRSQLVRKKIMARLNEDGMRNLSALSALGENLEDREHRAAVIVRNRPYKSVEDLERAGLSREAIRKLGNAITAEVAPEVVAELGPEPPRADLPRPFVARLGLAPYSETPVAYEKRELLHAATSAQLIREKTSRLEAERRPGAGSSRKNKRCGANRRRRQKLS